MKNIVPAVKGTRDFYPEEMRIRNWLYENIRGVSEHFGYEEYEGPFLEYLELYAAKSGEELVKEQSYVFKDRSDEWITLRPELTPSLARMIAQRQRQLTFPLRWWSFGPMWRYERPQRGRSREFFQWNIDLLGQELPEADAELASVGAAFLQKVGLSSKQVQIYVNNRRLLDKQLDDIGVPKAGRTNILRLIDRREKMNQVAWENYAKSDFNLTADQIAGISGMLENQEAWRQSEELVRFFEAIQAQGTADYIRYEPSIVRGLDYYTGTVFEARDCDDDFRAILGGGRYDNLVAEVGGDPLAGVGFAMGDMVIQLVLAKFDLLTQASQVKSKPVLVTVFSETTLYASISTTANLRSNGIIAVCYNEPEKLGKQFKYADRINASAVIVLGPDEIKANHVTVKDLSSGEQITIGSDQLVSEVMKILAS